MRQITYILIIIQVLQFIFNPVFSQEKPPEFKPSGKFSGLVYADYLYTIAADTGILKMNNAALKNKKDFNAFAVRRAYFSYDYEMTPKFSGRFRLEADGNSLTSNGRTGVFIKDLYVKWKSIFKGSDLTFGIQPTPLFDFIEPYWGYRSIEKTFGDLYGFVPTRDFGISLKGKIDSKGMFNYWVLVGNNTKGDPEKDNYKRFYASINIKPIENLDITFYSDINFQGGIKKTYDNNVDVYECSVGYKIQDKFRLGTDLYYQISKNGMKDASGNYQSKKSFGFSLYANFNLSKKLLIVSRFDHFEPNSDTNIGKGDSRNYFIEGLGYKLTDNLEINPNLLYETYEKVGNIQPKASAVARLTVYWNFK